MSLEPLALACAGASRAERTSRCPCHPAEPSLGVTASLSGHALAPRSIQSSPSARVQLRCSSVGSSRSADDSVVPCDTSGMVSPIAECLPRLLALRPALLERSGAPPLTQRRRRQRLSQAADQLQCRRVLHWRGGKQRRRDVRRGAARRHPASPFASRLLRFSVAASWGSGVGGVPLLLCHPSPRRRRPSLAARG